MSQVNDGDAAARPVATAVDLCKNGSTTTTTMGGEQIELSAAPAAGDQPASKSQSSPAADDKKILYGLDDIPSWYLCIFLGLQVFFSDELTYL